MILDELHAAHKARLERMATHAQASYEPPPPSPAPPPEPPTPLPEIGPMKRILHAVSRASGVPTREILSTARFLRRVEARHVFFWLCHELTNKSDYEIGLFCGGRDHSAVWAARAKIERRLPEFQGLIDASKKALDDMPRLGDET